MPFSYIRMGQEAKLRCGQ